MATHKTNYKLVVLGSGGVGKSTLTMRLVNKELIEDYDPTIEDCYRITKKVDNTNCGIEILDTAGQEDYSTMLDQWIQAGQGYLLVFDVTNEPSFKHLESLLKRIVQNRGGIVETPVVIAGNKCDLRDDKDSSQVDKSSAMEWAQSWDCKYYDTSAKEEIDNEEVFYEIIRQLRTQQALHHTVDEPANCCGLL